MTMPISISQAYERLRAMTGKVDVMPRWQELEEKERAFFMVHTCPPVAFEHLYQERTGAAK